MLQLTAAVLLQTISLVAPHTGTLNTLQNRGVLLINQMWGHCIAVLLGLNLNAKCYFSFALPSVPTSPLPIRQYPHTQHHSLHPMLHVPSECSSHTAGRPRIFSTFTRTVSTLHWLQEGSGLAALNTCLFIYLLISWYYRKSLMMWPRYWNIIGLSVKRGAVPFLKLQAYYTWK